MQMKLFTSKNHEDFLTNLFNEYNSLFFRTAYKITQDKYLAEDALSEAFEKITRNIDRISNLEKEDVPPYCMKIVKNTAIDIIKKKQREDRAKYEIDIVSTYESFPEEKILEKIEIEDLIVCIRELGDLERHILSLRIVEENIFSQIGEKTKLSEEASKKRYQRLIKKLLAVYEKGVIEMERLKYAI